MAGIGQSFGMGISRNYYKVWVCWNERGGESLNLRGSFSACLCKRVGLGLFRFLCHKPFFGPQMMFFHRLEENLIFWEWNMEGLIAAFKTSIWFWIPAHTITFILPTKYQIGLAVLWSIVLGIILGLTLPEGKSLKKEQKL